MFCFSKENCKFSKRYCLIWFLFHCKLSCKNERKDLAEFKQSSWQILPFFLTFFFFLVLKLRHQVCWSQISGSTSTIDTAAIELNSFKLISSSKCTNTKTFFYLDFEANAQVNLTKNFAVPPLLSRLVKLLLYRTFHIILEWNYFSHHLRLGEKFTSNKSTHKYTMYIHLHYVKNLQVLCIYKYSRVGFLTLQTFHQTYLHSG